MLLENRLVDVLVWIRAGCYGITGWLVYWFGLELGVIG